LFIACFRASIDAHSNGSSRRRSDRRRLRKEDTSMSKLQILFLALLVVAFGGSVAVAETAPEAVAADAAPGHAAEAPASSSVDGSCADDAGETSSDLPAELRPAIADPSEDDRVYTHSDPCWWQSYSCQQCPNGQVKGCNTYRCVDHDSNIYYKTLCGSCKNFC
jgi:hypothetical protein